MLCDPVTYETFAFQLNDPVLLMLKSCERYTRPAMPPLSAHPAAHCSVTRVRTRVGFGSRSKLPHPEYTPPNPASRRRRLVTRDDKVACITRNGFVAPTLPASGDTRAGSVMPDV